MFELEGFANIWEHSRLLSDNTRNQALIDLLKRHAPGKRVLEIGCGSGLLSCIAAKLGAKEVLAIEPTAVIEVARELIARNKLTEQVHLLEGRLQDLTPQPVDFVFSELLNADPFYEDVVDVMNAARAWVGPAGILAPRRLRIYVALTRRASCAREVQLARRSMDEISSTFGLDLSVLSDGLQTQESYRFFGQQHLPVSEPVLAYDVALGSGEVPAEEVLVQTVVQQEGPVDGALAWFECELDDGLSLHNTPGSDSHWGQLVCGWSTEHGVRKGQAVPLQVSLDDNELDVIWVA